MSPLTLVIAPDHFPIILSSTGGGFGISVGVYVTVGVEVGVLVGVDVEVGLGVGVGVSVGSGVDVGVGVMVGTAVSVSVGRAVSVCAIAVWMADSEGPQAINSKLKITKQEMK